MSVKLQYKIGSLKISPPLGWLDVTDEIGESAPPFTLARKDGVGVIQFSDAAYESGKIPTVTIDNLRSLLSDFAQSRELGRGYNSLCQTETLLIVAQSFDFGTRFLRVWYCSNRRDIALITYNCEKGLEQSELDDCEKIIHDLEFTN